MRIVCKRPEECSEELLEKFKGRIAACGLVTLDGLMERIRIARKLIFGYEGEQLVALGAIKIPCDGYKERIFNAAGLSLDPGKVELEIGWIYITPTHRGRGYCRKIVRAALKEVREPIFLTVRSGNCRMIRVANSEGFFKVGEYRNNHGEFIEIYFRIGGIDRYAD